MIIIDDLGVGLGGGGIGHTSRLLCRLLCVCGGGGGHYS